MKTLGTPMLKSNIGSDLQKAYISAAHKPNNRIGIKPIKPAKPKFVKKPL